MEAPRYLVLCSLESCQTPALYKVAAVWSDGTTQELKTYALSCAEHLESQYRMSAQKQLRCRVADGETLSSPQIFQIVQGRRDRELTRLSDLEAEFATRST
jgi:hypothetical protein